MTSNRSDDRKIALSHCRYCGCVKTPSPEGGHSDPAALRAVAALADPSRQALYAMVSDATEAVTREQAAAGLGISRKLAAFHLDKLVQAGLLVADYHPAARTHALGRTPKAYRRAPSQVQISIPQREPVALAALLLDAVDTARPGEPARDAACRTAEEAGRRLGAAARATVRAGRLGSERTLSLAEAALRERGYQPLRESPTCVRLRNCPFEPLAAHATELVCDINLHLISGLLDGLQPRVATAVLAPEPDQCCVELRAVD
jgi:predicted ArsR family transcriptional regulator